MAIDPRVIAAEARRRTAACQTCGDEKKLVVLAHGTSSQATVLLPATIAWDKLRGLRGSAGRDSEWDTLVVVYGYSLGKHVAREYGKRAKGIINAYATEIACPDCVTWRVVQTTHTEDAA